MRLYVPLSKPEIDALVELAHARRRRPQDQAAVLIGKALAEYVRRTNQGDSDPTSASSVADEGEVVDAT